MSVEIAIPFKLSLGSIKTVKNDAEITRQHVMALLNVNKGERVVYRDYGSPFLEEVFNNLDANGQDASDLQDVITNTFRTWEPGVIIKGINLDSAGNGVAAFSVNYSSIDAPDSSLIGNTHTATFGVGGRLITQVTN